MKLKAFIIFKGYHLVKKEEKQQTQALKGHCFKPFFIHAGIL